VFSNAVKWLVGCTVHVTQGDARKMLCGFIAWGGTRVKRTPINCPECLEALHALDQQGGS
jgi:hypothetical protein